jgi:hypothetical protein
MLKCDAKKELCSALSKKPNDSDIGSALRLITNLRAPHRCSEESTYAQTQGKRRPAP